MASNCEEDVQQNDSESGYDACPLDSTGEGSVDLENMTLEKFMLWTRPALESFLRMRSMKTDGSFQELRARAFTTWEMKIDVNPNEEHVKRVNLEDYKQKLRIGSNAIPDPFTLKEGWYKERDRSKWPAVYFVDISDYFKTKATPDLVHRLCNEYKQGKGYRYFTDGHVKEVHFHPISRAIPVAFFSAQVKPSMRSIACYQVWIVVQKQKGNDSGGHIHSAYCTCTAGLHGACNHIAGVLFRIENFVMTDEEVSKTSKLCTWTAPSASKSTEEGPKPLCSYVWSKKQYLHRDDEEHQRSVKKLATEFTPLSKSQMQYVQKKSQVKRDFAQAFQDIAPDSCFIQLHNAKPFPVKEKPNCPQSLTDVAKAVKNKCDPSMQISDKIQILRASMVLSEDERTGIEINTREQGNCEEWKEQRRGRITASKFHRVYTRTKTLLKKPTDSPDAVIKELMGYEEKPKTASMKHGLALEPQAKIKYRKLRRKEHKQFFTSDSGLVIHPTEQYIAASPDLLTECQCHGKGIAEIKCPSSIKNEKPSPDNWEPLKWKNGKAALSESHQHYSQIQGQMGVLGVQFCDFFVYTNKDNHMERIYFDETRWADMLIKFSYFWGKYLAPELFLGNKRPKYTVAHAYDGPKQVTDAPPSTSTVKTPLTRPVMPPVFLCGECSEPIAVAEGQCKCSQCHMKFHLRCLGLDDGMQSSQCKSWVCDICMSLD